MKRGTSTILCVLSFVFLFSLAIQAESNFSLVNEKPYQIAKDLDNSDNQLTASPDDIYNCYFRIYLVEPVSRYKDDQNHSYEFGFLDWPLIDTLDIADQSVWEDSVDWDASSAGFGSISEDNIMAIAVAFTRDSVLADAYPGNGYYYFAFYADAAAGATPGTPGKNESYGNFTHTVFAEEGTATW